LRDRDVHVDRPVRLTLAAIALLVASAQAGATRAPVSLIASPAHLLLRGSGVAVVEVANSGTRPAVVASRRGRLGPGGPRRPRIGRARTSWLAVRPSSLTLAPGASAKVSVEAHVPPGTEPGDHAELVLLTTRPLGGTGLAVRMRLGVVVVVRAPGRIVRRLSL